MFGFALRVFRPTSQPQERPRPTVNFFPFRSDVYNRPITRPTVAVNGRSAAAVNSGAIAAATGHLRVAVNSNTLVGPTSRPQLKRLVGNGESLLRLLARLCGFLLPRPALWPAAFLGVATRRRRLGPARGMSGVRCQHAADVRSTLGAFQSAHSASLSPMLLCSSRSPWEAIGHGGQVSEWRGLEGIEPNDSALPAHHWADVNLHL